ncbi:hypothetical protein GALMADRAFT_70536, partial [Galerina marginata CBS 339.88]
FQLCCVLVAWLSLRAGVSRDTANKTLKALAFILFVTLNLISSALSTIIPGVQFVKIQEDMIDIPSDIRTVYSQNQLDPELKRIVCCPKCFTQYDSTSSIPRHCIYKKSKAARRCNTDLFKPKHSKNGPKLVPRSLFTTQTLHSWLLFFLSRAQIIDALNQTFASFHTPSLHHRMRDIHDSPAWSSFRGYLKTPYHLVFALYVDWFNPFTNKIAGKVVSCGAIILYCLNLPLSLRFLAENVFILGMMPGPFAPDTWTISHILEVVKKMFLEFDLPGVTLATKKHPDGITVAARILAVIADLQAARKVSGFLSHSANSKWKALMTVTARDKLARKTGVRWTPLHDLPYWNPVKHLLLGFMHNFLEGILQHHLRILWGIGRPKAKQKATEEMESTDKLSNSEMSEDVSEASETSEDQDSDSFHIDEDMEIEENSPLEADEPMTTDSDSDSSVPSSSDSNDQQEPEDNKSGTTTPVPEQAVFNFNQTELSAIRKCIHDVSLPTWVERPPSNLGEAAHGKLKAHELLVLFAVIFPLVIPGVWWDDIDNEHNADLLQNFCNLVFCTNIIAGYSVTNDEADAYTNHYIQYRRGIQKLFSWSKSVPNHHYAMHNGDLLKFWGPLAPLGEFAGERMNGEFGKTKTNRRFSKYFYSSKRIGLILFY